MAGILPCSGSPGDCDRISDKYAFGKPADDSSSEDEGEPEPAFKLTLQLHNKPVEVPFYSEEATIQDLSDTVAEELHIPPANQKFLILSSAALAMISLRLSVPTSPPPTPPPSVNSPPSQPPSSASSSMPSSLGL